MTMYEFINWNKPDDYDKWCLFTHCKCVKHHPHTRCFREERNENCNRPFCTFQHNNLDNRLKLFHQAKLTLLSALRPVDIGVSPGATN